MLSLVLTDGSSSMLARNFSHAHFQSPLPRHAWALVKSVSARAGSGEGCAAACDGSRSPTTARAIPTKEMICKLMVPAGQRSFVGSSFWPLEVISAGGRGVVRRRGGVFPDVVTGEVGTYLAEPMGTALGAG